MNPARLARAEIRALEPYASARAVAGRSGILLNANENPWPPPGDDGRQLNRYPDPQPQILKGRLAALYGVKPEQLLITRGSDEGIDLLVRAFCRAGIDQVLVCPPCFGLYALSARIQGAGVTEVPLVEQDGQWRLDRSGLNCAPPCRLYFLCSPNNPTGQLIPPTEALALAAQVADHGLVIVDEAYLEFTRQASLAAAIPRRSNLVVLRTLSKAHALAGCRVGSVIADARVIELLRGILAPYPLPTPSIEAALRALDSQAGQDRRLAVLDEQKARLLTDLKEHPAITTVWPGEANFVLVRANDGPGLVRAAAAAGIVLRDQSAQTGLANCVRISVGTPAETETFLAFLRSWTR